MMSSGENGPRKFGREKKIRKKKIEDVERGAGHFADPASSSNFVFKRPNFGFRQTDGQTGERTDRRNKHILGLNL